MEPTLVSVHPGQSLWRDEAVQLTNNSSYGLSAAVFTCDLRRAHEFIDRAETGQVAVNLPTSGWDVHHRSAGSMSPDRPPRSRARPACGSTPASKPRP